MDIFPSSYFDMLKDVLNIKTNAIALLEHQQTSHACLSLPSQSLKPLQIDEMIILVYMAVG